MAIATFGMSEEAFLNVIDTMDYSFEFGTCIENGEYKAVGANIASEAA